MRIEIMERPLPSGRVQITLVNAITRRYIGQLGPKDSYYNANHIKEAVYLYQDLHDAGLLPKVLAALEAKKKAQEQQK